MDQKQKMQLNERKTQNMIFNFKRMQLFYKASNFTNPCQDLKSIYLTYIRSALEQSAVVWHSSYTTENRKDF